MVTGAPYNAQMTAPVAGGLPVTETTELPLVPPERRRRRPWRTGLGTLALLVICASAGIGAWLGTRSTPAAGPTPQVTTTVVPVTTGTMRQTVASSGTLEPDHEADLSFAVPGVVTAIDVTVGETVTTGQALASVAATALEATEESAAAALTAAQARLAADESAGAAASQVESDEATVTSAESQLSSAQADVRDATLTSPIDGTVASVDLEVDDHVAGTGSAGGTSGAATSGGTSTSGDGSSGDSSAQLVVVGTDAFVVDTSVDATEVGRLSAGQRATVTPDGSARALDATVESVGLIASGSSGVASFPVVLDVTGSPSGLYAGTSASVSIVAEQLDHVVEVPAGAISYRDGRAEVVLVEDGHHLPTAVTTGVTTGGMTQITSGLHAGEQVVERELSFVAPTGTAGRAKENGLGPVKGFVKEVPGGSGPVVFNRTGATGATGGTRG